MGEAVSHIAGSESGGRYGENRLEWALQMARELASWSAKGDLLRGVHEVAVRLAEGFSFTRCTVFLQSPDDPQTLFLLVTSDDATLHRYPLQTEKYPELQRVLETRQPLFIADVARSEILGEHSSFAAKCGGCCSLAVPFVANRQFAGVVSLRSTEPRPEPGSDNLALLCLVAQMIAVGLGNNTMEMMHEQTLRTSVVELGRRRRERAIEQYRDVLESFRDAVMVVDGAGEVVFMNRASEQLTGYSRSGLAGRPLSEIMAGEKNEKLSGLLAEMEAGAQVPCFFARLTTTSGETLVVSASVSTVLVEHGAVVLSLRDVTVARALEEELRKTKDFLERLINAAGDGIVAADLRGNVILFNSGAERIFGYRADEVIGKLPVWKLYPNDNSAREAMAQLRSPEHGPVGRLGPVRREIVTRNGVAVPISLTASIIYENQQEVATVGILSDLRERLHMEERLAQAQEKLQLSEKQALIADLAGTTAHELNQPLTSVVGYAELLKKRMESDDSNRHAVDIILREAERMAAIVRKIGKITRYETKAYVGSTTILDLDKATRDE